VNDVAAAGFTAGVDAYERGRPEYPADVVSFVVDRLGIAPGRDVLDLAAGTGKFTRALRPTGARVVAVEPLPAMRARLSDVEVVAGTAESIPFAAARFDAVTVAQAFHWFDAPVACAEIARVLRPGGGLALLWNERDDRVDWVAALDRLFDWPTLRPFPENEDWVSVLDASACFEPASHHSLEWNQPVDVEQLVARVLSTSYVATWTVARQATVADAVRAHVADFGPAFDLPHVTNIYWCTKPS
jgi:ubiquinone/menaquinone biosynthesis C-methylase UbiE